MEGGRKEGIDKDSPGDMSIHTPIETDASEDRQSEREEVRRERARGRATPRNRPGIGSPAMLFPQKMIISDCII